MTTLFLFLKQLNNLYYESIRLYFFGTIFIVVLLTGLLNHFHCLPGWYNWTWLGFLLVVAFIKNFMYNTKLGKWINSERGSMKFSNWFIGIGFLIFFAGLILLIV